MPAAMNYPPPESAEARELEEAYLREMRERRNGITRNRLYYENRYPRILKIDEDGRDDNVSVNLVKMVVEKGAATMLGVDVEGNIEGVRFLVRHKPGIDEPDDPAQVYLDKVLEANRKNLFLLKLFRNASLTGHVFMKVLPPGWYDFRVMQHWDVPRLVALDPMNVAVFWREDDHEIPLWFRIQHDRKRQDIVAQMDASGNIMGDAWRIVNYERRNEFAAWVMVGEETWDYPFCPIIDWQNIPNPYGYYGLDDVSDVADLNVSYNAILSYQQRMLKYKAHPVTFLTGGALPDDEEGSAMGPDRIIDGLPPDAKAYNVEISGDALNPSMTHAEAIRRALFNQAREVDPQSIEGRLGKMSNFDLQVLYADTLAKRQERWLTTQPGLRRMVKTLLAMNSMDMDTPVDIIPPNPLPQSDYEKAQSLQIDMQFGLSKTTALEKRGYDPRVEQERRAIDRLENQDEQIVQSTNGLFDQLAGIGRRTRVMAGDQAEDQAL